MSTSPATDAYASATELDLPSVGGVFAVGDGLAYASVESVGAVPVRALAAELRAAAAPGAGGAGDPRIPRLTLHLSSDAAGHFDPDLSIREPLELQVREAGELTLEIEFVGEDPAVTGPRWPAMDAVLGECGEAWGLPLVAVFNDPGRSLAEVWNARFAVPDDALPVRRLVDLARRLAGAAEFRPRDGEGLDELRAVLHAGDAHALIGVEEGPVLQALPVPDDGAAWHELALHVAAFANGLHGGVVVVGARSARIANARGTAVAAIEPFAVGDLAARVERALADAVFPVPGGILVEAVDVTDVAPGEGLIAITVPPQQRGLKPFLVHEAHGLGWGTTRSVCVPVREGERIRFEQIAAIHGAMTAGRLILSPPIR